MYQSWRSSCYLVNAEEFIYRTEKSKKKNEYRFYSITKMFVINDENNRTEYYADDFTKGTEGNLHVSVEFNIDGKYEKSEIR